MSGISVNPEALISTLVISGGNAPPVKAEAAPVRRAVIRGGQNIKARYEAAMTTNDNAEYWRYADGLTADQANSPSVRSILRSRARYEGANSPYVRNIIRANANSLIGRCPLPQVRHNGSQEDGIVKDMERDFRKWAKRTRLGRKLRVADMCAYHTGEAFLQLFSNPALSRAGMVSLDLIGIPSEFVTAPVGKASSIEDYDRFFDGVEVDEYDNPKWYYVQSNSLEKPRRISAEYMIHWYYEDRPGQHRQVPEITAGLNLQAYLRSFAVSCVKGAQNQVENSIVVETSAAYCDSQAIDINGNSAPVVGALPGNEPPPAAFELLPFDRSGMTIMPGGTTAKTLSVTCPPVQFDGFHSKILNEFAAGSGTPYNIAAGNSSGYNYSSGQLDHLMFYQNKEIQRYDLSIIALDKIMELWAREYLLMNRRPEKFDDIEWNWQFDAHQPIDPVKAAVSATERQANGTSNLRIECAKLGLDAHEVIDDQLELELYRIRRRKELGLPDEPSNASAMLMNRSGIDNYLKTEE